MGSGAIGMEFASFFSDMGAEVTVVEMLDRILPSEDADISDFAAKAFKRQGMTLHTSAGVSDLKAGKTAVSAGGVGERSYLDYRDGRPGKSRIQRRAHAD